MKRSLQILLLLLAIPFMAMAQNTYTVTGKVVDKSNGDPLPGANIILVGTSYGNASNTDGTFKITDVPGGSYKVRVSYVGFTAQTISVDLDRNVDLGTVALPEYEFSKEVIVSAKRAVFRKTPVAFTDINKEELQKVTSSGQDLSMAVANVPGVYATVGEGGIGDSRLTLRGFSDNNIGILINGVPVNDMESGHMYWSDWAGIAQVTNNIQVTQGLGANPLSTQAVGGTVNIVTSALQAQKGGTITQQVGDFGLNHTSARYSTGIINASNGGKYGVTALVSRETANSFFNHSHYNGFTFFVTAGYNKGNNTINFTALGSPQEHDQRSSYEKISTWDTYGLNYNPNIGVVGSGNAQRFINERVNYYFKPVFSLDDTYRFNDNSYLTTTLYYSWGTGWGSGPLTQYGYHEQTNPETGLLDYNQVFTDNMSHTDSVYNAQGQIVQGHGSQGILRRSWNNHTWSGIMANYTNKLSKEFTLNLGFDGRYYVGQHYRTVSNLLGGDFWVESTNQNLNYDNSGYDHNGLIAYYPGDKIAYENNDFVKKYGVNGQLEYATDQFSAFIDGAISNTGYARRDYFVKGYPKTPYYNFTGYIVKGGVNVNLTSALNVYFNAGYNNRAPYFNGVFQYTNTPIENRHNEKVTNFELGLGLKVSSRSVITADLYHTRWGNQTFNTSAPSSPGSSSNNLYNVQGLNEIHKGLEVNGHFYLSNDFSFKAGLALEDNYYENDVQTTIFNQNHQKVGVKNLYIKNLKVSASPQTMATLSFNYRFHLNGTTFFINPRGRYLADYYSEFNPTYRTSASLAGRQGWKMPAYGLIDMTTGFNFKVGNFAGIQSAQILFNLDNIMNTTFISDAYDVNGTRASANVFYGNPRTAVFTFKFYF